MNLMHRASLLACTVTCEFRAAIPLLTAHGVQIIAMESTGVYGVILHEMLQEAGFDVWLVTPPHLRCAIPL